MPPEEAMTATEPCPDPRDLELLLLGHLTGPEAETLERHILGCDSCVQRLRGQGSGDRLLKALRGQAADPRQTADTSVEALMKHLQEKSLPWAEPITLPPGHGRSGGTNPEVVAQEVHTLLGPPRAEGELGWLGRYRVLKILGAGGMGIVLEAEDTALQRPVALKVLKTLAPGSTAQQRFLQEARATAAVIHDHIVTIHDVDEATVAGEPEGTPARSVPFLAMQLLRGETLEARLQREGRLPTSEVLRIGREVAAGLAGAHARGLIHRDIKPANVWLEAPAGRVKILDFGLVRATSAAPTAETAGSSSSPITDIRLTQEGAILGTPAYMAPEQALARTAVDARCDLFSLGCVLYRMCTGRLPFDGADTMSILCAVAADEPLPPARLIPTLAQALSDLVMRLLAKRPEDRPASAEQVVDALTAIEHTLARPRRIRAAVALTVCLLLALGVWYSWPRPDPRSSSEEVKAAGAPAPAPPAPPEPPIAAPARVLIDVSDEVKVIDTRLRAAWTQWKVTPSLRAGDYEFARRASLDIIGRIPRLDEIRVFLKDPPDKRRALLIERLLASEDYARHWAELWSGWLLGHTGTFGRGIYHNEMTDWLKKQFDRNRRYHEIVRDLITAEGRSTRNGAVHFTLAYLGRELPPHQWTAEGKYDMVPLTGRITRLFLGMQIQCAQCHNHPFQDTIKQEHFWTVNIFLRQVEREGNPSGGGPLTLRDNPKLAQDPTFFFEKRNGIVLSLPKPEVKKRQILPPAQNPPKVAARRRDELATTLIDHDNFSRAIVNRMWGVFFGREFLPWAVSDEFGTGSSGPSHPELLDDLAVLFKNHNYDLAMLIRWICNSEAYQLSSVANNTNGKREQEWLLSRRLPRPLTPEQFFDSLQTATGAAPAKVREDWLGRLSVGCEDCEGNEIDFSGSLEQALSLLNGPEINDIVAAAVPRAVAEGARELQVSAISAIYHAALSRPPRAGEIENIRKAVWDNKTIPDRDPDVFYEDLFWALLNSNEFALNH
jgi:serine/threonine protein kinase